VLRIIVSVINNFLWSVDQELATCGVLCVEMCGAVGSGSCMEEGQGDGGDDDDEAESDPVPSFTEALRASESERSYMLTISPKETK
jgi:hypothetical protein